MSLVYFQPFAFAIKPGDDVIVKRNGRPFERATVVGFTPGGFVAVSIAKPGGETKPRWIGPLNVRGTFDAVTLAKLNEERAARKAAKGEPVEIEDTNETDEENEEPGEEEVAEAV